MAGFFFEHLYSERVVFVARPGHPLTVPGADLFARIGAFPMLLPPPGSIIRPIVERFMIARAMPRPAAVIETVSHSFGRAFLRASDATWVISEGVVADDLAEGSLCALPLDTSDTSGSVGLTKRIDVSQLPGLEMVALAIRQAAPVSKR